MHVDKSGKTNNASQLRTALIKAQAAHSVVKKGVKKEALQEFKVDNKTTKMVTCPSCKQATHAWPTSNLCPNKKAKAPIDGEDEKVEICFINVYMTSCNKCKRSTFGEYNDSDVKAKSTCCIAV
ncbi:hypothetical protein BDF20DRAFT_985412 [Mycotypha africana]|uniref:uncharacterized protein n=1 Tax=Mycotypha africana TaxID=64632 RepID=UPI002300221D|nr:uncharacterized protein BDF20DRAFT_985412 [Mycotypha africana]KAI8988041.1 hypothetical protein BDF20DRAFT_985412 [Mycotypha africana]